jgi:ribose transport system permease protein
VQLLHAVLDRRRSVGSLSPIWVATLLLFLASALVAPGTIALNALTGIAPFAAVLAVAALGQTLVVQQRGLDLSVPGMISLTTMIVTRIPAGDDSRIPLALAVALGACVLAGSISGVAVTRFGITPLVATLGVNALLIGLILQVTNGTSTSTAPPALDAFAAGRTLGLPNTVIVALVIVAVVTLVMRATAPGRRFVAVGANPLAANVAGLRVGRYVFATYVVASIMAGIAGVMLAGFLQNPGLTQGNKYLLPTLAAVVLGGTSLAGGNGSVVATAVGAIFLIQLQQVVSGLGGSAAMELIIQGLIIALGMGLRNVRWRSLLAARLRRVPASQGGDA